jgi:hypothetical protein
MFDAKRALALIDSLRITAESLQAMPEVIPIAREILGPVVAMNEVAARADQLRGTRTIRPVSEATRRKMRAAAQKRWRSKKAHANSQSKVSKSVKATKRQ